MSNEVSIANHRANDDDNSMKRHLPAVAAGRLNNRATPSGDSIWRATQNLTFGDEGGLLINNSEFFVAHLEVPDDVKSISLKCKIHPAGLPEKEGWIAIGIGDPTLETLTWPSGIFLLINNRGGFQAFASKTTSGGGKPLLIKEGRVPDFDPDNANSVALQYDSGTGALNMSINDSPVVDGFNLKENGVVLNLRSAGFSGFGQTKDAPKAISDFLMETAP